MRGRIPVALAILCCACSRHEAPSAPAPAASAQGGSILLNEIGFAPKPFVEVKNGGLAAVSLDGLALANDKKQRWQFPAGKAISPGGVYLAADAAALIGAEGSLALVRGDDTLDFIQWDQDGSSVYVQPRGGYTPSRPSPGSVIGRPPSSNRRGAATWTSYPPGDATPGAANRLPRVTGLLPLSGATLAAGPQTLTWYSVVGATGYRVQIGQDRSFARPLFDRTIDAAPSGLASISIPSTPLSGGRYLWRVQASFAGATTADFSRPSVLFIRQTAASLDLVPSAYAADATPAYRKVLAVPFIPQRKDTRLLALEAAETGAEPWDAPWPPRTGPYCARASIAMVAAFFGGNVSQDRITYAAFNDLAPGPLYDIYVKTGFKSVDIHDGLKWALNAEPAVTFSETLTAESYYEQFRAEIDRGKPSLATSAVHAWVVVGYGGDARGKYLVINDPAIGQYDWLVVPAAGVEDADLESPAVSTSGEYARRATESYFFPGRPRARSDEPEVQLDSDGDGVMDWDETTRFGTRPRSKDSDGDGVPDKEDIRAWVFDQDIGWSFAHPEVSPFDGDGDRQWMHVDLDSDNGGCADGLEDLSHDGKHDEEKETWVIGHDDDPCLQGTYDAQTETTQNNGRNHSKFRHTATFSLLPRDDGTLDGLVSETFHWIEDMQRYEPGGCAYAEVRGDPQTFSHVMGGKVEKQPDGSVRIVLDRDMDPGHRPQYSYRWVNACRSASGPGTIPLPFFAMPHEFKLVNGVYDYNANAPAPGGQTQFKVHFEQKKPQSP